MRDDDLYLTNRYKPISYSSNKDNSIEYKRLLNAKERSGDTYRDSNPKFTENVNIDRRAGIDLPEDSPGFEQYLRLSSIDKNKKVKKTIVNIDSRNRQLISLYDKEKIILRNYSTFEKPNENKPFYFPGNSLTVYLLLETVSLPSINNKQIIIINAEKGLFNQVNLENDLFIFNTTLAEPIFSNLEFYYDPLIDLTNTNRQSNINNIINVNKPNINTGLYTFNVIKFNISNSIDPTIIYHNTIGDNLVEVVFCENIKSAYQNTSHFIVNLGKSFSNIYSIRMISSEIPNAAYTFNGSEVTSDIGRLRLSSKINNKLRWISQDDSIKQLNYHILDASLFNKYNDSELINNISVISQLNEEQLNNFNEIKSNYTISSSNNPLLLTNDNEYTNYKYRISLDREITAYSLNNNDTIVNKDQFTNNYIGSLNTTDISIPPYSIDGTIFKPHKLVHSYYNDDKEAYLLYGGQFYDESLLGCIRDISGFTNISKNITNAFIFNRKNDTIVISIDISENSINNIDWINRDIIKRYENETRTKNEYPIRIQFHSLGNTDVNEQSTYIYDVINVGSRITSLYKDISGNPESYTNYRINYTLYTIPVYTDLKISDTSFNSSFYFNNGENVVMTIWNSITDDDLANIQLRNPYAYRLLKEYYLQTATHTYTGITDLSYSQIDCTSDWIEPYMDYSGNIQQFIFSFKNWRQNNYIYSYNTTIPTSGKFSINYTTKILYLNYIDNDSYTNDDIIHNLYTYNYLLIFPFYFKIDPNISSLDISNQVINISYTDTNYYITPTLKDLSNQFIDNTEYNLQFQEYDIKNIQNLYILDKISSPIEPTFNDIYNNEYNSGIIRLANNDLSNNHTHMMEYIDLFMGNINYVDTSRNIILDSVTDISNDKYYHSIEVRYKDENNFFTTRNTYQWYNVVIYLFEECNKSYIRNSIQNYMNVKTRNINLDNQSFVNLYSGYKQYTVDTFRTEYKYIYDLTGNTIPYIYDQTKVNSNSITEFANMADTVTYKSIGLSKISYSNGLTDANFTEEFISSSSTSPTAIFPSINNTSNQVFTPYLLEDNNLIEYERFPVYSYNIQPGKYNETTLTQYINTLLKNVERKNYNYQREQFSNDIVYNDTNNLFHETGTQSDCKMVVNINRNINVLQFKYYRNIFTANPQLFNQNQAYVYYNEGFPYLYFNIPDISIPNGSFILVEGVPNIDNIPSSDINREHRTIIPKNYRVQVRQLLPLPNIDYFNNKQNMFANEGYVQNALNDLYNEYIDYINASINDNARNDIGFEFIMDRLFNIGESDYARSKNENKLINQQGYIKNEYQFYKGGLNKIYSDNYGKNRNYDSVNGYGGQQYVKQTRNKLGLEYIGSALVNNANNDKLWNEYNNDLVINNGFQTTFINNECFVRLSDLYQNIHTTLIGHISYRSTYSDQLGNITVDYDLFSDNNSQFTIGDIIIGLDSQTIGVILPYDYKYAQLPTSEVKLLGLGAYILHTQNSISNFYYDRFKSIDNLIKNNEILAKYFIKEYSNWIIAENKTNKGFYIKLSVTPNISRLTRVATNNLKLYIPEFFNFLNGIDTPLDLFGFKDPKYNNEFNYFKDNYTPFDIGLIRRSYIMDLDDKNIIAIYEMKENCNAKLGDNIYIENHNIINTSLSSYTDRYYNVSLLEPFSKYITKIEAIYNTEIQNYNGYTKAVEYKLLTDKNYFVDNIYSLDISDTKITIPFKNKYIAHNFNENKKYSSNNYLLYYNASFDSIETGISGDVFMIDYNLSNGLKLYFNGNNTIDILNEYRTEPVNIQVKIIPYDDVINSDRFFQIYYKPYNKTKFYKSEYNNIELVTLKQYYIQIHITRRPVIFKSRDTSFNMIDEYDTIGVFERIMSEWMNSMLIIYRNDINKANYFNNLYNPNIFNNRIIKLKVSPIDNNGFSYEPLSTIATSTNGFNREIKGYSRKLFPYCEYTIYNTYNVLDSGKQVLPNGNVYRNFLRPKQIKSNEDSDAKIFLKGMGVYVVNEKIDISNITSLPATAYSYTNKFIGYVLDTSVDYDNKSWFRDYILDADTFSKVDVSNSLTSEYYIYLLMDEDIQTRDDVEELYKILDTSYNHIIFDANAREDEVISIDGIINSNLAPYAYSYNLNKSTNTISFGSLYNNTLDISNNFAYIIDQNVYGNTCYLDSSNNLYYQEDKYISNSNRINNNKVDGLLGLTTSQIVINRKKANKTLPFYNYQTRLACATIIERPVVKANDISNTKLFITGEYDFFYKNYMENKTIMYYDPVINKETVEYLNKHQFIDQYPYSSNFKSKNYKEIDCHNGYIDSFYQKSAEYAQGLTYINSDRKTLIETSPQCNLDIGDDFVFINSNKRKPLYNGGPNYNQLVIEDNIQGTQALQTFGIESYNIKVLLGSLLPQMYLDNTKFLTSSWNNMFINKCILDLDYNKHNLESFNNSQCLAKSRGYDLDIVGFRSDTYLQNTDMDKLQNNIVGVTSYIDTSNSLVINSVVSYTKNDGNIVQIEFNDPKVYPKLVNNLVITFPVIQTNFGQSPIDFIDYSEMGIIDSVDIPITSTSNTFTFNLKNELINTNYINNKIPPYDNPTISMPYKVYDTVRTSWSNEYNNTCISSKFNLPEGNIICFKIPNDIQLINDISIQSTKKYSPNISYFHNEMIYGDTLDIIIDYGKQRQIDYDIDGQVPYIVGNTNGTSRITTSFLRINTDYSNRGYNPFIFDHSVDTYINSNNTTLPTTPFVTYVSSITNNIVNNGVYRKYPSRNNIYLRYDDMNKINRTYYDINNNKLVCSYDYLNNIDNLVTTELYNVVGNVELNSVRDTFKYAELLDLSGIVDFVYDLSYARTINSGTGQLLIVQGQGIYEWNGTDWLYKSPNDISYNNSFEVIIDGSYNTTSFYKKCRFTYDNSFNYIPIYEHELYRNPLYYDFFLYDKIDFQVNDISNVTNTILPNRPDGVKLLDLHSNKLYLNYSDLCGNNFVEYSIPDKTTIKVYQDLSTNGILKEWQTINQTKLYYKDTNTFYNIDSDDFKLDTNNSINEFYDGPLLSLYPSGPLINNVYRTKVNTNKIDWSGIIIVDDNGLYDVSGVVDMSGNAEATKNFYDGSNKTYKIDNPQSLENKIVYTSYIYDISGTTNIFSKLYPFYTDYTIYDILTSRQADQLLYDYSNNSLLRTSIIPSNSLILDNTGQYYRFDSSNIRFDSLQNIVTEIDKNICIYGKYSGHQNMLFKKNINNEMVYSQYYSDLNAVDYYYSYGTDTSSNNNYDVIPLEYYMDMSYNLYDRVLVHFNGNKSNYVYIVVPRNNQKVLVREDNYYYLDISNNGTVFDYSNNTVFINNENSYYRGQTFYRDTSNLLQRVQVSYTNNKVPIYYPNDTRIIALTNPLRDTPISEESEYNCVATQPFLSNNEWYTKILYRGSKEFIGRHIDIDGRVKGVFNDIEPTDYIGGNTKYGKYEAHNLFISRMKGLRMPIIDITDNSQDMTQTFNNTQYIQPIPDNYYLTTNPLIQDYSKYLEGDIYNRKVYGEFIIEDKNFLSRRNTRNINYYDTNYKFNNSTRSYEYPYIIIKGIYLGYGGHIQARYKSNDINTIVNNDSGFNVLRVSQINSTQYIYTQIPIIYSQYFNQNEFNIFQRSGSKARNSLVDIPLDLQLNYLDKIFTNTNDDSLYNYVTVYGENGRIVKKSVTTPYNLNPNNYIFLVIPNLNHIESIQNNNITDNAFAKILLPGDSNRVLFNTYVSSQKIYYDYLFNNLNDLEIAFVTNSGDLFDFNGSDLSFSLEITEIIDKLDYINPRFGNIEF
jgi:hypothetical protein